MIDIVAVGNKYDDDVYLVADIVMLCGRYGHALWPIWYGAIKFGTDVERLCQVSLLNFIVKFEAHIHCTESLQLLLLTRGMGYRHQTWESTGCNFLA